MKMASKSRTWGVKVVLKMRRGSFKIRQGIAMHTRIYRPMTEYRRIGMSENIWIDNSSKLEIIAIERPQTAH